MNPPLTPLPPTPQSYENIQILPLGNVRLFRIIHKNDTLFMKINDFPEHLVNLCVFPLKFSEFLRTSTNSTLGKRASFSQNSEK